MLVRGSFRPATLVNLDMIKASYQQFRNEQEVDPRNTYLLTEITMDNLCAAGELDEQDFLDRAELLNTLGHTVVISDCQQYQKMIAYLADYKVEQLGIVLGVRELLGLIDEKYYQNMDGRLLAAFGELFTRNIRFFIYPALQEGSGELINAQNAPIPEGVKFLYRHLLDNRQLVDVQEFNPNLLHIFSKEVLHMLQNGEPGWESMVSSQVASLIKEQYLFGFPAEQMEFDY